MRVPALRVAIGRFLGTATSPAGGPAAPSNSPIGVRVRLAVYAAAVLAWGSWVSFTRLGEGGLVHDEAAFAFTTDHMLASGDLIVPRIDPVHPHLNATPLYNWLSVLTADHAGPGYAKYRLWAAVFMVGCGLATLTLGALLFGPEAGLLAAFMLLSNRHLLFAHGARAGVMETGLAFFVMCGAVCYVLACRSVRPRLWWALAGVCLAGAVLTKPPAMGGFYFVVVCCHHLVTRRDLSMAARLTGPLVAVGCAALLAGPWYTALYQREGMHALKSLFVYNSVGRAQSTGGHALDQPWWFYLGHVWESSRGYGFALPAVAVAAGLALAGRAGLSWGLPALLAAAFIAALSYSATKHTHYLYSALPLLAVPAAALALAGLRASPFAGERARVAWRVSGVLVAGFAVLLVSKDCRAAKRSVEKPQWDYPPAQVHDALRHDIEAGRVRLVLFAYPDGTGFADPAIGFTAGDHYYAHFRLPMVTRIGTVRELNQILADGKPTLLFLPPFVRYEQLRADGFAAVPDGRWFTRSAVRPHPLLTFHGAEAIPAVRQVLDAVRIDESTAPQERPAPIARPAVAGK